MDQTERAIILKTGRFREADLWVRLLTPQLGVLTAFAFGGLRSRRRFCGCLDVMNQILVHLKSSRTGEYLSMTESSLLHSPRRLREDPFRLGLAVNCLKFLDALTIDPETGAMAHQLLLDSMETLETAETAPSSFPVFFRGRLAFDLGFAPELEVCCVCGRPHPQGGVMRVEQGRLACCECPSPEDQGLNLPLSAGALEALRVLRHGSPNDWVALRLPAEDLRQGLRAVDSFVRFHLGLAWDRTGFRRV